MTLLLHWLVRIAALAVIAYVGVWVAEHPGAVVLDWGGWRVTTSLWVLIAALATFSAIVWLLTLFFAKLSHSLRGVSGHRRTRDHEHSIAALTETVAALSCGDYTQASRQLQRSAKLLGGSAPLTLMLEAHLAARTGDNKQLRRALSQMQEVPQTRYLAHRSLSLAAGKEKDTLTALEHARSAYELRPDRQEALLRYLGLLVASGEASAAQALITDGKRRRCLSRQEACHLQALVHATQAAKGDGDKDAHLATAFRADPGFAPAYGHIVRLCESGRQRQGFRALCRAWKAKPHPELTDILLHYFDTRQPEKMIRRAQVLAAMHPQHIESHLALARAALGAKNWDMARSHLKAALSLAPQMRVLRLLATLESDGAHDEEAASKWLKRMQTGQNDPAWHCMECGHRAAHWHTHCESCDGFDSYRWLDASAMQADLPEHASERAALGLKRIS